MADGNRARAGRRAAGLSPGWTWDDLTDRLRWLRPAGLALAGCLFSLPFLTVSCDAPEGYGPVQPGGTTTYSGFQLAFGSAPSYQGATNPGSGAADVLGAQVLLLVAIVLVVAATAASAIGLVARVRLGSALDRSGPSRHRQLSRLSTVLVAATLLVLLLGEAVAHRVLTGVVDPAVRDQPSYTAGTDYVHDGQGYVLVTSLLLLALLSSGLGALSRRRIEVEQRRGLGRSRGRDHSGSELGEADAPTSRPVGDAGEDGSAPGPTSRPTPHELD